MEKGERQQEREQIKHKETRGKSPDEPWSLVGQAEVGQAGVALRR